MHSPFFQTRRLEIGRMNPRKCLPNEDMDSNLHHYQPFPVPMRRVSVVSVIMNDQF